MKAGRKRNKAKDLIAARYSLTARQRARLTVDVIRWIAGCRDESARRVLMGLGRRSG
jgi:hypothetical protein